MTALERVLSKLEGVTPEHHGEHRALCPAHADSRPSLYLRAGDGRVLMICRSHGCTAREITTAVGLRLADLFDDAAPAALRLPAGSPGDEAPAEVEAEFRRQAKRMAPFWGPDGIYALSDDVRINRRYIDFERRVAVALRKVATERGPDDERAWSILGVAAEIEGNARAAELDADALEAELELRARG
jgi:hypothetical protein